MTAATPSAAAGPVLSVRDLVKTFTLHALGGRRVLALRGVSLDVHPGEHVAVAGPSGAGKSSLLRCVHRLYRPDSGTVLLHTADGPVDLTALPDRAMARLRGRELGWVPQFLSAPPRTGPLALVATSARRRGLPAAEAEEAAVEALRTVGIGEQLWPVDCSLLSGGERQRVNLAAGTVRPPRLLLLDEPVSALDPVNRERALGLIERLNAERVSVMAVYHDVELMHRLTDRVVVVDDGLVAADGSPQHVLSTHTGRLTDSDGSRLQPVESGTGRHP